MFNFLALDLIAAGRGDGLRPELRELLQRRATIAAEPKVADLAAWRVEPAPAGSRSAAGQTGRLPASILRFPDPRVQFSTPATTRRKA